VPKYAAFLRGINVSNRRASKEQLCACFEDLGYEDVSTFRASGNVVFSAGRESVATMTRRIEGALARALGYDVMTFLRAPQELGSIAEHDPFAPAELRASSGKLQVMLLPTKPSTRAHRLVLGMATEADRLAFGERELYWLPSGGMLDSELRLAEIETLVGPTTKRTKGTIEQIAKKYFAD
jgi:uncharacterized protein (DUF1697 family)